MENEPQRKYHFIPYVIVIVFSVAIMGAVAYWLVQQESEQPPLPPPPNGGTILPPDEGDEDKEAPSIPSSISGKVISATQVMLSWGISTDDVAVIGYRVYRDGKLIESTPRRAFTDNTVRPSSTYTYVVTAYDNARHESLATEDLIITTPAADETTNTTSLLPIRATNNEVIQVKNFYNNAVEVTKDDVFIKDNEYYTLIYFPADQAFLVAINNSNVPLARAVLESDLPEIFGISKNNLCKLKFSINVPFDVNEKYLKETINLSFCPNGTPL